MTDNTQNEKTKPDWKLVQEKAYNKTTSNGQLIRQSKTVEITVGWTKISDAGNEYIFWADSVVPVESDIDGRIKLVTFAINPDSE